MCGDRYRHIDLVILQTGKEVAGKFLIRYGGFIVFFSVGAIACLGVLSWFRAKPVRNG